jgi:hypothetical protein
MERVRGLTHVRQKSWQVLPVAFAFSCLDSLRALSPLKRVILTRDWVEAAKQNGLVLLLVRGRLYKICTVLYSLGDQVIPYVKSTYGDFHSNTNVTFRDYSLDANKGVLYVSYRLGNYEIKHIAMECNLCSNTYKWEEFRIDVPLQWGKQHDANANAPTYISRRHLAMKGMPKYLPMYSMRSLYEVITNKISQHELVIRKKIISIKIVESPYSGLKKRIPIISLCIMDSRFNRNTTLYRKIASFGEWDRHGKIFVMSPYQDIVGIYNLLENQMHNELHMIGIMLINELSIVNEYKQQ